MNRLEKIAKRVVVGVDANIVASEVTDEMERQVRYFLRNQARAIGKVFGGTWVPGGRGISPIKHQGQDTIIVSLTNLSLDDPNSLVVGFKLKYDYGMDTYDFTPFKIEDGRTVSGKTTSDFYVEDLGDVSKLEWIFKRELGR